MCIRDSPRTVHVCRECGASAARWSGRCTACGAWNSLVEQVVPPRSSAWPGAADRGRSGLRAGRGHRRDCGEPSEPVTEQPVLLSSVDPNACEPSPTGIDELDRVPVSYTHLLGDSHGSRHMKPSASMRCSLGEVAARSRSPFHMPILIPGAVPRRMGKLKGPRAVALDGGRERGGTV